MLLLASLMIKPAVATPEDEVRSTFDRFVAAQNAHDIKAVESLLLGSPDFLRVTRGAPVWGQDAALTSRSCSPSERPANRRSRSSS